MQTACVAAVLMYHRVGEVASDVFNLAISPARLREHARILANEFHPVSLQTLTADRPSRNVPPSAVCITFDDGGLNNLTTASPILIEHGLPATFFVTTAALHEPREFWWDTIVRILLSDRSLPGSFEWEGAGETPGETFLRTDSPAARLAAVNGLAAHLRTLSMPNRDVLIDRLVEWSRLPLPARCSHRPMLAPEVIELSTRRGHTVGAHTVRHLSVPLESAASQHRELGDCKRALEALTGQPVTLFAYPFGHYDDASVQVVRQYFEGAVTTVPGGVSADTDRFTLPRIDATGLDGPALRDTLTALFQ